MSQNLSGMRNIILFLIISTLLLLFIFSFSQTKNTHKDIIKIGIDQYPGFEHLFIAKKEGFFKEVGLEIELIELSSLAEVRRAFERGKIDGMASTLVELLEAYKYSKRIAQVVLVIDFSNGADVILASPEIKSMRDLMGKSIGVESGSLSVYLTYRAIQLNKMKPSDVMMIPMSHHEMLHALENGEIDAITSYPPTSITIKKLLEVNNIFDSSKISEEIIDVLAIDNNILKKFPDIQTKLHQAWDKTYKFVQANPNIAHKTLVERLPISIEEFKTSMYNIDLVPAEKQNEYLKPGGITIQALKKIGNFVFMQNDEKILDYSQFVYNQS